MSTPNIEGLNHIGLIVEDIEIAKNWFQNALGLDLFEDRGELAFFYAGRDIIAIKTPKMATLKPEHGAEQTGDKGGWQSLDHYGFFAKNREDIDAFASHILKHGAEILKGPYDRSDGRSVYFKDPCGLVGEYLYFSPLK